MPLRKPDECPPYQAADEPTELNKLTQEHAIDEYWKNVNTLALYQLHESQKIVDEMKCAMLATLRAARRGYATAMLMYELIFGLGVALIIAALGFGLVQGGSTLTILLTSAGTVNLLTFLVRDPPRLLQENRAQLTKLMAAHFSWWTDNTSLNLWLYGNVSDTKSRPRRTIDDMLKVSEAVTKNACAFMEIVKGV